MNLLAVLIAFVESALGQLNKPVISLVLKFGLVVAFVVAALVLFHTSTLLERGLVLFLVLDGAAGYSVFTGKVPFFSPAK